MVYFTEMTGGVLTCAEKQQLGRTDEGPGAGAMKTASAVRSLVVKPTCSRDFQEGVERTDVG